MRLIIAGSRTLFPELDLIEALIHQFQLFQDVTEVVSGGAIGVDSCGETWAKIMGQVEVKRFRPDYKKYSGSVAPKMRNQEMAEYSDALLLIWDGKSRGSLNMKENMQKLGKPIYEVILK